MRLLFAGSIPDDGQEGMALARAELAREISRALGRAMGEANMEIVIGSADPDTPDAWFLEGVAEGNKQNRIRIVRPRQDPDVDVTRFEGKLAVEKIKPAGSWAAVSQTQLAACDAVLLLGGRQHVRNLGYSGAALGKVVLGVPWLGGGGKEIFEAFDGVYRSVTGIDRLQGWSEGRPEERAYADAAAAIVSLHSQRAFHVGWLPRWVVRHALPVIILLLAVALLCLWVYVFSNPTTPLFGGGPARYFLLAGIAAALGTLLRNSLRATVDSAPYIEPGRLIAELTSGLLLAFGLGLLFLVGAITIDGDAAGVLEGPSSGVAEGQDSGMVERIAVVMTLLGLTGGLFIEQVADVLRKRLMGLVSDGS